VEGRVGGGGAQVGLLPVILEKESRKWKGWWWWWWWWWGGVVQALNVKKRMEVLD